MDFEGWTQRIRKFFSYNLLSFPTENHKQTNKQKEPQSTGHQVTITKQWNLKCLPVSDETKSPKSFGKSISLLCLTILTKWEVTGFLLTCVEVRICVLIHFLVLQNIVRDLGPNCWLNVHPLQGDNRAGWLYCWGQTKPRKGDRESWLFSSSMVCSLKEPAYLKMKSPGFRLTSCFDPPTSLCMDAGNSLYLFQPPLPCP